MSAWVTEGKRMIYERGVASGEKGRKGGTMNAMWVLDITFRIKASFSVPEAARKRQSIQVLTHLTEVIMLTDRQSHLMSSGLQMSAEKTLINVTHLLLGNYRDEIG